jgi:hypothetical protein
MIRISLLHIVVKRVRNSTPRFRFVLGKTDNRLTVGRVLHIASLVLIVRTVCEDSLFEVGFLKVLV